MNIRKPSSPSSGPGCADPVTRTISCCPPTCTITSQTVATNPINRDRKTIGVGEEVILTFSPGTAHWIAPDRTLNSNIGNSVKFTAPDCISSITVTAEGCGCSASISFQVIAPIDVHMEIDGQLYELPYKAVQTIGFRAFVYLTPDSVSFQNIEVIEGDCLSLGTGGFENNRHHVDREHPNAWVNVGPPVAGKGSKLDHRDKIERNGANEPGTFSWLIPWLYRVKGKSEIYWFVDVLQEFILDSDYVLTARKGGVSVSRKLTRLERIF